MTEATSGDEAKGGWSTDKWTFDRQYLEFHRLTYMRQLPTLSDRGVMSYLQWHSAATECTSQNGRIRKSGRSCKSTFGRNRILAKSQKFTTFGAETVTDTDIRSTSSTDTVHDCHKIRCVVHVVTLNLLTWLWCDRREPVVILVTSVNHSQHLVLTGRKIRSIRSYLPLQVKSVQLILALQQHQHLSSPMNVCVNFW